MKPSTYRKVGPRTLVCTICQVRLSTNALARAGHERGKLHKDKVKITT